MKIHLIIHRKHPTPHMEVHYEHHVEFWDYNDHKLGEIKVEAIP